MQSRTVIEREEAAAGPASDYLVVGRDEPDPPGIGARVVYGLQIVVILLIALLSFAIFWVVGLLLNIF